MMQRNCLGILFLSPTNVFANYLTICYCQYYCHSSSLLLWFIKMVFPIYSCHFIMLGGSGVIRNLASNLAYLKKNLATIQHKLSTLIATRSRVGLATQVRKSVLISTLAALRGSISNPSWSRPSVDGTRTPLSF